MSEKKSTLVYQGSREAEQKFDYFICALTGAIFTYVAQTYKPRIIGLSPDSLEPLALAFLVASFFFGLKRIEMMVAAMRMNFEALSASESAGSMTDAMAKGVTHGYNPESGEMISASHLPVFREHYMKKNQAALTAFEEVSTWASRYYGWRNHSLVLGFAALFFAKLLSPYFAPTTYPKELPSTPRTEQATHKSAIFPPLPKE